MGYENGMIYKLCCNDTNIKEEYIGSTVNFNERKRCHKNNCNNPNNPRYNYEVYQFIRDNGGFENFSMVLVEKYPCNDKLELTKRERHWIELIQSKLNYYIPTRTRKEYLDKEKDKIKQQRKEYRNEHKQEIKEYNKKYRLGNALEIKEQRKQYYQEHKEEIKEYRKKNIDKEKEKITCECGCEIGRYNFSKHLITKKHINLMIIKNNTEIKN